MKRKNIFFEPKECLITSIHTCTDGERHWYSLFFSMNISVSNSIDAIEHFRCCYCCCVSLSIFWSAKELCFHIHHTHTCSLLTHLVHRNVIHTRVAVEIEKTARQNEREREGEGKKKFEAVIVVSHTGHFQDRFMYFILRGSVQAHIFNRLLSQRTDMSTTEHARINAKRFRFWAETDEKKIPFLISFWNFILFRVLFRLGSFNLCSVFGWVARRRSTALKS